MNENITEQADFIICGGGISGILLAFFISRSETLKDKKVLVLEKNYPDRFARNFSFWYQGLHPFEKVIRKKWRLFTVHFEDFAREFELNKYQIQYFQSREFFQYIDSILLEKDNLKILKAEVLSFDELKDKVIVKTDRGNFKSDYVFDSIRKNAFANPIIMQGYSWKVCPRDKSFDDSKVTLFDFRETSNEFVNFYYSLPLSDKESIFYRAGFTRRDFEFSDSAVENDFKIYLTKNQQINEFEIKKIDHSKIEFTGQSVPQQDTRIFLIGAKAGLVQKSTSYGFVRIMENSQLMVEALEKFGHPVNLNKSNLFYKTLDYLTMRLMLSNPKVLIKIYRRLFKNLEDADLMFKFLDEKTGPAENFRMLKLFLK